MSANTTTPNKTLLLTVFVETFHTKMQLGFVAKRVVLGMQNKSVTASDVSTTFTVCAPRVLVREYNNHMYPLSVATHRHRKPTLSFSSAKLSIRTANDKHYHKENYPVPLKSMTESSNKWTIRIIYLIGFMVKSYSNAPINIMPRGATWSTG